MRSLIQLLRKSINTDKQLNVTTSLVDILALKEIMNLRGSATLQDYKDAFDRLDADHSGYIETSEVKKLLDSVYDGKAPSFEIEAFINFFDADKDGRISWSEFERGLGSALARQTESNNPLRSLVTDDDDDDEDHDVLEVEPEVSGTSYPK